MNQQDCRDISRTIFAIKRRLLGEDGAKLELKARQLLTRGTFKRRPEKRELVEQFYSALSQLPITLFAVIMQRPERVISRDTPILPSQYRHILDNAQALLPTGDRMAVVLVDGDGSQYGGLSVKFEGFLHRSRHGLSMHRVMDTPFFVDSAFTMGIQIADMVAGTLRLYYQNEVYRGVPGGDAFLAAIDRYYRICRDKTVDHVSKETGWQLHGFHIMQEARHYPLEEEEEEEDGGPEDSEEPNA